MSLRTDNITVEAGTSSDIWFACAPADLGGGTLKVDVNTTTGVLSRTVQIGAGKLAFQRGRISKFGVNMESAVFTPVSDRWVLVTDASTLAAGDEIIITNSATAGAAYAMSTTQNNNNRGRVAVSIAQDTDGQMIVQNPGSTVEALKPYGIVTCGDLQRLTVGELAAMLKRTAAEVIKKMFTELNELVANSLK